MTLIEFFDKCPLENIIGSLALRPGRVIFLGSNRPKMEAALTAIRKICREQELHAIISYRMVAKKRHHGGSDRSARHFITGQRALPGGGIRF